MNTHDQLVDTLRKAFERPSTLHPAIVKSVDLEAKTCQLEMNPDSPPIEARLNALADASQAKHYFLVVPKLESSVLVAQLGESWVVLLTEQINTLHIYAETPLNIQVGEEKLGTLLQSIIDAIATLQVPTPAGLSSVPFQTTQDTLTDLTTRLEKLLTTGTA